MRRPCLKCGVLSRETYCPEHRKAKEKERLEKEPHRTIYGTKSWAKARKRIKARDNGECQALVNGKQCKSKANLSVHHITPLSRGGAPYDDDNLITLCRPHHEEIEKQVPPPPPDLGIPETGR